MQWNIYTSRLELGIMISRKMDFQKVLIYYNKDLVQIFFSNSSNLVQFGLSAITGFKTLSNSVYSKFANDFMQAETYTIEMMLN